MFTQGYKKHGIPSVGTVQVLLSEIAQAYLHGPRTQVSELLAEESVFECKEYKPEVVISDDMWRLADEVDPSARAFATTEESDFVLSDSQKIGCSADRALATTDTTALPSCHHFEKCRDSASCYKALIPLSKLKGLVDEWDIKDVTDFRCDVCANCPNCKRSARERTKSLQEEHEQVVICLLYTSPSPRD